MYKESFLKENQGKLQLFKRTNNYQTYKKKKKKESNYSSKKQQPNKNKKSFRIFI